MFFCNFLKLTKNYNNTIKDNIVFFKLMKVGFCTLIIAQMKVILSQRQVLDVIFVICHAI